MLFTLIYFFLALLLLITVHELGHFWVARLCGVKVLRFSFGFGKVLARCYDKRGTEYAWSLFPFGGYVKMLDENEADVPEEDRHLAFNNKSVWARMAIIMAGPLFNFIFAFLAFWLVLVIGIQSLVPIIQTVKPGSIAAAAGLRPQQEIISLNNKIITNWRDVQFVLMPLLGSEEKVNITVTSLENSEKKSSVLSLRNWTMDAKAADPLASLGIKPFVPSIPPVIGEVLGDSPAKLAGLQAGDMIKTMNNKPLTDWLDLVTYVKHHPNTSLLLSINRAGLMQQVQVQIVSKTLHGQQEGFIGLRSQQVTWPEKWLHTERQNPVRAIGTALRQTIDLTAATFSLTARFLTGKLGFEQVSGPVGIAQGAGESARSGFVYYLSFLALVSISLGVLNSLPIPPLDGGHLLYCLLEMFSRRPLAEGIKLAVTYAGLVCMVALMVLALSNDLSRLLG